MKNQIQYIPLSIVATAYALCGSLSANETAKYTNPWDDQSQQGARTDDKISNAYTSYQLNAHPVTTSDILAMNIETTANKKIAEIDDIYINTKTGEVLAIVVSTGGALGVGEQQALISPDDIRLNANHTQMQTNLTKEQIQTATHYIKGDAVGFQRIRPMSNTAMNHDKRHDGMAHEKSKPVSTHGETPTSRTTDTGMEMNQHKSIQTHRRALSVSELIGMNLENSQGEVVGEVEKVFLDLESKQVAGVVVSTGGFLGIGDRKTLFSLREMSFDQKNEKILIDYNSDQIGRLAEYKPDDQTVFENLKKRMSSFTTGVSNYFTDDDEHADAHTDTSSYNKAVLDQGNSSRELAMTISIRSAIREDGSLSTRANNVTIITNKEQVVLSGEVDSASEKKAIEGIAKNKAGSNNVTSELTVRKT